MKPLTRDEKQYLAYFIKFCDGIYDRRGGRDYLLSGSGRGKAPLGDAFNGSGEKAAMRKCLRRGYIQRDGSFYAPTEKGREAVLSLNPPEASDE